MTMYIVISYSEIVVENKPKCRRNKPEVCLYSIAADDEDFWQFFNATLFTLLPTRDTYNTLRGPSRTSGCVTRDDLSNVVL